MSRWIDFAGLVAGLILCTAFIYQSRPITDIHVTDSSVTFRVCRAATIPTAEQLFRTLEQTFGLRANITKYNNRNCFSGSLHNQENTHPAMKLVLTVPKYQQLFEQLCRAYINNYGRIDREMAGKVSVVLVDLLTAN